MSGDDEDPGGCRSIGRCCGDASRASSAVAVELQEAGVRFQDASTTIVDSRSSCRPGAWIGAGSQILGTSSIERDARVGPYAIVVDSQIGTGASVESFAIVMDGSVVDANATVKSRSEVRGSIVRSGAEIGPNALLESSTVASDAKIGPFSRVRSGSEVCADAYIGTQAEVKASRIGVGSKVGHFSFIGDAELGCGVNVGAGSVTANFDGHNVRRTFIGDEVSLGAGTLLVAPLRLGKGAKTGAGAVVTKDVCDGDLVLGVPARTIIHSNSEGRQSMQTDSSGR